MIGLTGKYAGPLTSRDWLVAVGLRPAVTQADRCLRGLADLAPGAIRDLHEWTSRGASVAPSLLALSFLVFAHSAQLAEASRPNGFVIGSVWS